MNADTQRRVVFVRGVVAGPDGGKSAEEKTDDIRAKNDKTLAEAGRKKTNIITATVWLTDMDTWAEMNTVWDTWVVPGETPCRAAVQSSKLAGSEFHVEIMVVAAL